MLKVHYGNKNVIGNNTLVQEFDLQNSLPKIEKYKAGEMYE